MKKKTKEVNHGTWTGTPVTKEEIRRKEKQIDKERKEAREKIEGGEI